MKVALKILTHIIFLCSISLLKAQHIQGFVFDKDTSKFKQALVGATLKWMNQKKGAISDERGYFHLDLPDTSRQHRLVISYLGYGTDTILITTQRNIEIYLSQGIITKSVLVEVERKASYFSKLTLGQTEIIGSKELLRAACCNLSESFETNPSVDVNFADALTGAKQIRMLGLEGVYTQIMKENIPAFRGLANTFGLSYLPGTWIESIQLTKGAGSVINGYESMAGQINVELKKPLNSEPVLINYYADQMLRNELNITLSRKLNEHFGTALLLHGDQNLLKSDRNNDGFLDQPLSKQLSFLNRWEYFDEEKIEVQFGISGLMQNKIGGQVNFNPETDYLSHTIYGLGINTNRWETYGKFGLLFPEKPYKSIGLILNAVNHQQNNYFGTSTYDGHEQSFYSNLIYQSIIKNTDHKFKLGGGILLNQSNEKIHISGLDSAPNMKEIVPGIFGEYNYTHLEKYAATLGLRLDNHNLYGWMLTPRIHTKYNLSKNTILRASAGKGYRTPYLFAENTTLWSSSRKLFFEDKVQQEISWNYGASLQHDFKISGKDASFQLDYYRTIFQKQIILDLEQNPHEIHIYQLKGISFANSFQAEINYAIFKNLSLRSAYKNYDVRMDYKGDILPKAFIPKQRFLTTVSYNTKYKKYIFDATALWYGMARIPSTELNPVQYQISNQSPAYWLFHFQATRNFKKISIYIGSENLFDFRQLHPILASEAPFGPYFDASMIWGPVDGRRIYFGLRWKIGEL